MVVVVVDSVGAGAATGDSITLLFSVSVTGTFSTHEVVVVVVVDSGELLVLDIFSIITFFAIVLCRSCGGGNNSVGG